MINPDFRVFTSDKRKVSTLFCALDDRRWNLDESIGITSVETLIFVNWVNMPFFLFDKVLVTPSLSSKSNLYVVIVGDIDYLTSMWICTVIMALCLILVRWIHRNSRWNNRLIVSKEKFDLIRPVVMLHCWQIWVIDSYKFESLRGGFEQVPKPI